MTRYFYDCELHEDGLTTDLISIGIVTPYGRQYYAINAEAGWMEISAHPWLVANVLPSLPGGRIPESEIWKPDMTHPDVKGRVTIAREVEAFIRAGDDGGRGRDGHELWADYGAYDHVALCQLFGRMIDLPDCIPMFTHDLQQAIRAGACGDPECDSCRFEVPEQTAGVHNALGDARHNLAVARALGIATPA